MFDLASELERAASLGFAPNVIYDDDGNWAIVDEGVSTLRMDDSDDFSAQLFGEAKYFKPTPELAWMEYLERLRASGNDI